MGSGVDMAYEKRLRRIARKVYRNEHGLDSTQEADCERCGEDKHIEIHHIDFDAENNTPSNLMATCHECHWALHRRKKLQARLSEMRAEAAALGGEE